jgi:hypothetical protein
MRLYAIDFSPIAVSYDLFLIYQRFSVFIISSSIENVLTFSHLREYNEDYFLLRLIPILRFNESQSVTMPLLLLVSILGKECMFSNT